MNKQNLLQDINDINSLKTGSMVNSKLKKYNTGKVKHLKQLAFHMCNKKNRWVFGGNRSGKTECGAVETVWLARGIHPYRQNKKNVQIWVVSLSTQVQRDVAQEKVLSYLSKSWIKEIVMLSGRKDSPQNGVIDYITIKNIFGGESKIGFKSCDQGRDKFQGTSLDYVWFDEEPPEDIYKECRMRVLDRCGEIYGTMTPLKGLTWVYNTIYLNEGNDEEVWCEFMEWADNPYLSPSEIKSLTASLSESELEARRYGKFINSGGQVYSEFDESINVIEPFNVPQEWYDNISIDPGLNNPLSAHWYAVDYDNNIYVIAEHYETKQTVEYHAKKIKEICRRLNWQTASNGMYSALIDSAANQRTLSSPKNVCELFYDNGILVNPKVNKDLYSGINRVKSYLKNAEGISKLFIFKNCTNMIREIKGYFWGNNDTPIKKDDHAMDELRYYIMSRPENQPPQKQKTLVQKDKERLMRKLKYKN
ncbi:MAG: terminase family protein [Eubacteriales bacterium]|nr:terminase family protein [Eubacteriales bacterium]